MLPDVRHHWKIYRNENLCKKWTILEIVNDPAINLRESSCQRLKLGETIVRILALSNVPAYYQVPIFRGLSEKLNGNFMVIFGNSGHSAGVFEPTWKQVIKNDHDLLSGYHNHVIGLTVEEMDKSLPENAKIKIKDIISEFSPTIIFTNRLTGSFCEFVILFSRSLGAKVIVRSTPNDLGSRPWWKNIARHIWYRFQYTKVDAACAVSSISFQHFEQHRIPHHLIFNSNYCTDEWVLKPMLKNYLQLRINERQRLKIPQDAKIACFAGRFIKVKRIDMLVEAASRFQHDSNLYFIFAGSGPMWADTVVEIKHRGLKRVLLPGFLSREQTANLFACADLLLLPSDYESYGVVVQEAMMFGCAWVASDHVGSGYDLKGDAQFGRQFRSGDMTAFEQAIDEMLILIRTNSNISQRIQEYVCKFNVENALVGIWSAIHALHRN